MFDSESGPLKTMLATNYLNARYRNENLLKEFQDNILNSPHLDIDRNSKEEIQLTTLKVLAADDKYLRCLDNINLAVLFSFQEELLEHGACGVSTVAPRNRRI
jgi:hypothetical protein